MRVCQMDEELTQRWKSRLEPFNGVTLELPSPGLSLADLRSVVETVVAVLKNGAVSVSLMTLADWHQHDAYVSQATPSRWSELLEALASDEAFLQIWPGDTFVRRAYFPSHRGWYLRIWFDDDDELDSQNRPTRGNFDVTGPEQLAAAIQGRVSGLMRHPAAEFFDHNYAG
jgi:hypothetical protein